MKFSTHSSQQTMAELSTGLIEGSIRQTPKPLPSLGHL